MSRSQSGFTLMEVVVSTFLLMVALTGVALSVPVAMQANHRNRVDAEATMLAQRELEQMIAQPLGAAAFTDADGNNVSLAAGGSPLLNGTIDFSQPAVDGYSAIVTGSFGSLYQLRWNAQFLADGGRQFTMGARKVGAEPFLLPPVNLSVRQGV